MPSKKDQIILLKAELRETKGKIEEIFEMVEDHKPDPRESLFDPDKAFALIVQETNLKNTKMIRESNVMMEGPLDHSAGGSASERFMQLYINPFKLAILSRFTALGSRIIWEMNDDSWSNGLGVSLIGETMEDKEKFVNNQIKQHYRTLDYINVWKMGSSFMDEQGDSIIWNFYEGDIAYSVENPETHVIVKDFSFMRDPVDFKQNRRVVKKMAFSRQEYAILEDDGQGNPTIFQVNIYLGVMAGMQAVDVHRSRIIWLCNGKPNNDFTGKSVLVPIYNELVIGTMILKATGEIAFRWSYGRPVILTKGLNETTFSQFKQLIGNPTREAWHILPSEWIESFTMLSNEVGNLNLPALGDWVLKNAGISTGIPKPILEGDVHGVVQGGKVNERSLFALFDKKHTILEPFILEDWSKDPFLRNLMHPYDFDFDWGLRFSMSAEEQVNFDVKDVGNDVTRLNYMTHNEVRHLKGYKSLEAVALEKGVSDPLILEYLKKIGNSLSTITVIDFEAMKEGIKLKRSQGGGGAEMKTTIGNDGGGKGEGVGHGEGKPSQIHKPETKRSVKSKALSRSQAVKNAKDSISKIITDLTDRSDSKSIVETAKELEMGKDKLYKMRDEWKNDDRD